MRQTAKGAFVAIALILCAILVLKGSVLVIQSGQWAQTGNLSSARAGASAALLQDGRILVAGGDPGTGPLASVDIFNTDGTISAARPMVNPRSNHVSVTMQDGRVLVAGGLTTGGGTTNAAEIYDPIANSWTSVGSGMMEARSGATAAVLQDGRVLVAGGQNGTAISSTIEIFNPTAGTFTSAGTMSSPRTQHAMTLLQSGEVLIVGGNSGNNRTPPAPTPVASTDIFDPVAGTVSAGPSLATARYNHSATTLLNGQVVVIGGNNGNTNPAQMDVTPAELIDFTAATPAFTTLATNLATPREGQLAFLLANNNNILIAGGTSAGTTIASAELFTAQGAPPSVWTYTFGSTGTMTAARSSAAGSANQVNATSTVMQRNGVLMVAGGADANGNSLISSEAYGYATVQTDASEYAPGSPVTITGSGWAPGETVTLSFLESPYFDTHPNLTAVADANGNISNNQFSPDQHDIGIMFFLTATGSVSQAQNKFADAAATNVNFATLGLPSGTSVTVNYNGTSNGGKGITGPLTFNAPGPGTAGGTLQGSAFSYSFSATITASGTAYNLTALSCSSSGSTGGACIAATSNPSAGTGSFTTDNNGSAQTDTVTATYKEAAPTVTAVSPTQGPTAGGTSVTITGTNFASASAVTFGGSPATTFTVNSSTQITATSPAEAAGTVDVTVTTPGGASAISSADHFAYVAPPAISKSFGASTVALNGTTSLTFTITNPSANAVSLTSVAFTDTLPTGLVVATPNNLNNTCGGTASATAGGSTVSLTGATLSANGSCTFSVNVTGTTAGAKNNSVTVTSTNGGTGNTSSASVTVIAPPTISKAFSPTSIAVNGTSTMTFTLTNPASNTVALTNVTFSDTFPTSPGSLVVASTPAVTDNCGGSVTATAGTGSVSLSGGSIPAGSGGSQGTCTVSVNVTPPTFGTYNNTTEPISSANGGRGTTSNTALLMATTRTTTTTITPTSATAPIGGSAQFTITVKDTSTGTASNPAGTVSFSDASSPANSDSFSTCTLAQGANSVGTVSCTVTATATAPTGAHTMNASFAATDSVHANSSTTTAATLTVTARSTTTTVAPTTATAPIGGSAMFTITVTDTGLGTASTPVGTVAFTDTSSPSNTDGITPCTLAQSVAGTATCTVTVAPSAPAGPHIINAGFAATDGIHAGSSTATPATLNVFNAATTTTITFSANPSVFGQGVSFTATVAPQQSGLGLGTPAGTVQFVIDGTNFGGAVTLSAAGTATSSTTSTLSVGPHAITATYTPAANSVYQASTSSPFTQTVSQDGTATLTMSSPNPSTFGQTVTITVTVAASGPGSGTPTGSVSLLIDNMAAGSLSLMSGSATTTTSSLSAGSHTITANYGGDGNFTPSTFSATQMVSRITPTFSNLSSQTIPFGTASITLSGTISASCGASCTLYPPTSPAEFVTITINGTQVTAQINANGAFSTSFDTHAIQASTYPITYSYPGYTNFTAATDNSTTLTVNAATTTTTLASTPSSSILGQAVAFTATVTDSSSGDTTVPNGTVNFFDGGTMLIGSATLNASGNATFTTALLSSSASPHSITAAFIGNADFSASTSSSPVSQTVNPRSTSTTVALSPTQVVVGEASTVAVTVTDTPPATPAETPGAFALTSQSLNVGRTGHAAALLPNGTVLIAGGEDASNDVLPSAEIYDPVAGTFTTVSVTLTTARTGATATLLNNGTVLIVGGSSDGSTALPSAEIYDPVAGTFTALTGAGQSLGAARFGHTATLLPNGNVLIAGGQNSGGPLSSVEIYNSSTQVFGAGPGPLGTPRAGHTATLLFNGTILFAGGSGLSSAELYNPSSGNSTPTGNITTDRTNHAATLLPDGNVLIAGGTSSGNAVNSTELYNTAAGTFAATGNMQRARSSLTASVLDSAQVLVVGGSNSTYPALASAELYAPSFDPLGTVSVTSNDSTDGVTGSPCTLTLNGTGASTCTVTDTSTEVGSSPRTITAAYNPAPDQVHSGSTGTAKLTVNPADTTTTVTPSVNPSTYGQSVTFTATVGVVPPGSGTSTGTVNLYDAGTCAAPGTTLATALSLSGGAATFTTSVPSAAASPHSILACYSGDANFNATGTGASRATPLTQIVKPAPTSTTVTSSANPSIFGQSVTFTATVTNTAGASISTATPTGSVQFYIDGSAFGSPVAVAGLGATATGASGATATLTVSGSPHTIKATFTNSDGNFSGSYGLLGGGQTVQPAPTSTSVSSSQNPSIFGQSVTFTATVMNTAGASVSTATPTGSVQFYIDGNAFGSPVAVAGLGATATGASGATATLTVSGSPHTIKATFTNSDGNFSVSYGLLNDGQTVNKADTTSVVTSNDNPSVYGQSVKFTATVSDISPSSTGSPTGTVTFMDGGTTLAVGVVLSGGQATFTSSVLVAATHSITAVYSGDGNFNGSGTGSSTAPALSQTVNPALLTITASSGSMTYGGSPFVVMPIFGGLVNGDTPSTFNVSSNTPPACLPILTSAAAAGTYTSTCSGAVDSNYTISYIPGMATVSPATTTTVVVSSSSNNTSTYMQLVTFTATVLPQYSGTPTGIVTFQDTVNGVTSTLGTASLSAVNGATFSTTTLQDTHPNSITAVYSGDSNGNGDGLGDFLGSTSPAITQTVQPSPNVSLSPLFVSFGNLNVGQKSGPATVTLSNIGDATLGTTSNPILISITQPSTDFTQTNNCPASLAPNNFCTITITFAPVDTGVRTANLQITDNDDDATGAQQFVSLTGAGLSTITGGSLFTDAIFATANGCGSIVESGGSTVDSFNSNPAQGGYSATHVLSGGNVGTNGNVTLNGSKTTIYGSAAVDSMTTGNCSKTSQTGVTTSGGAQVTGGLVALNGPITYPAPPAPNPIPPTTNQNISGSCGTISGCTNTGTKTVSLAPGPTYTYGNLSVSGGTAVHVSNGVYNFNSLTLSGNSILYVDSGPVVVNLAGASLSGGNPAMDLSGGSIQNPSGIPANLQFTYAGSRGVNLSGGSGSYATVYAPNAFVNMSGGSDFWGSIVAGTVTNSGGTAIHYDSSLPAIQGGDYIWFSAVVNNVQYNGNPITSKAGQIKLYLTYSSIQYTAPGTSCTSASPCVVPVPNAVVTFNSASQSSGAKTTYDLTNSRWSTAVAPSGVTGNTFVTGVAVPVPAGGFPGGIQNVAFQAAFSTDAPGVTLQWQWGAAVYASFSTIYATTTPSTLNVLGVNPEDGTADAYGKDPAGTPETYKADVIFGATGGGLTNYTGYLSTAAGVVPTIAPMSVSPSSLDFGGQSQGSTSAAMTTVLTNNDSAPHTISSLSVTGTEASDFTQTNNCPISPATLASGYSCTITVTFTPSDVGTRTAKIVVNDDANNSPQTVYLSGTGQ